MYGIDKEKVVKMLIGATDSETAKDIPLLIKCLEVAFVKENRDFQIRLLADRKASKYIDKKSIPCNVEFLEEAEVWDSNSQSYVELVQWANVLILCPLGAETMPKIVYGICDTLLTTVARSWDTKTRPTVVCPSFCSAMRYSPITERHLRSITARDCILVTAIEDRFKAAAVGEDIMCAPSSITSTIIKRVLHNSFY